MPRCYSFLPVILVLFRFSPALHAQSVLEINTQNSHQLKMSSYLNGSTRNHTQGYIEKDWAEKKFPEKVNMYRSIANNFSGGGKSMYRVGHNITDGNADYNPFGFAYRGPGWHWATEYGDGFDEEYYAQLLSSHDGLGLHNNFPILTTRLGAGVRRFFFVKDWDSNYTTPNVYSGFAVTVNYKNSITLDINQLPKSRTVYGNYLVPDFAAEVLAAASSSVALDVVQIGGPSAGTVLGNGNFQIEYRITNLLGDVAYWGFVISVNPANAPFKILRVNEDQLLTIDPNPSNFPPSTSALVRHSILHTVNCSVLMQNTDPLFSSYNENDIYAMNDPGITPLPLADVTGQYEYDKLEFVVKDAIALNADLSVGINISTGYPEEAVGLIEYLNELGAPVYMYELGCELMGSWNKGAYILGGTPDKLGKAIQPFAQRIRNSPDPDVNSAKLTTTSTYGFRLDFIESPTGGYSGNGNYSQIITDWLTPLKSGDKCLVDFINIHTYPGGLLQNATFSADKTKGLAAVMEAFDRIIVPDIKSAVAALAFSNHVGIVVTESNTGYESQNAPLADAQQNTITEGLFFAENFIVSAKNEFAALLPFAFLKTAILFNGDPSFNISNGDPSHPNSMFPNSEDPQQSIHFYPNSTATESAGYSQIFVKPVFKVKKMIFENLGPSLIPHQNYEFTAVPAFANVPYYYGSNINLPYLNALPTYNPKDNHLYILVTNRNADVPNGVENLELRIDGQLITQGQIMYLDGNSYKDKQPAYTNAPPVTPPHPFNAGMPGFSPFNVGAGHIQIPNLSICIIKVAMSDLGDVACQSVQASGYSCDAIRVNWQIGAPTAGAGSPLSHEIWYYEQLDGDDPQPTQFDPADPDWKLYTTAPANCNSVLITGLQFPQDEYPIAVVTSFQFQSPTLIGPGVKKVICMTAAKTTYCENRIDRLYVNTNTLTHTNGGSVPNPAQDCLAQLFDYAGVRFCSMQPGIPPVASDCQTLQEIEFEVQAGFRIDAVRLFAGTLGGHLEILYDDDLSNPAYTNMNAPITATLLPDTWNNIPFGCGIANIRRIKIKLVGQAGDMSTLLRKIVLYGESIAPLSGNPMPLCCGSASVVTVSQPSISAAIAAGTLLPASQAAIEAQEVFITALDFSADVDYTFNNSKIFFDKDVTLTLSNGNNTARTLRLTNSVLKGCEMMWKGIRLDNKDALLMSHAEIQDAETAVGVAIANQAGSPNLYIESSRFERNFAAIKINGFSLTENTSRLGKESFVRNIIIEGTTGNLKPRFGDASPRRAQLGISASNLNYIQLGDFSIFASIQINHVSEPVVIHQNSFAYLGGLGIDNRNFVNAKHQMLSAIGVNESLNTHFVLSNNSHSTSQSIMGCKKGKYSYGSYYSACSNVRFSDVNIGAEYLQTANIKLSGNKMTVLSSGILATQPESYEISGNTISHSQNPIKPTIFWHPPQTYGGIGIGINYYNNAFVNHGSIYNNTILVRTNPALPDAVCAGVLLNNAVGANVYNNSINLQNYFPVFGTQSRFYGVYKSGGMGNTICSNNIIGLNGYDRGIGSLMSPGEITCNFIRYTRNGMYFTGDNEQEDAISGNEIKDTYTGIYVNSSANFQAILGVQDHRANKWVNNWYRGGDWNGDQTFLADSRFFNNETYPFHPVAPVNPQQWFAENNEPNVFTDCLESSGIASSTCYVRIVGEEYLGALALAADSLQEPYKSMVLKKAWLATQKAYPGSELPQELAAFWGYYADQHCIDLAAIDWKTAEQWISHATLQNDLGIWLDSIQSLMPAFEAWLMQQSGLDFEALSGATATDPIVELIADLGKHLTELNQQANLLKANGLSEASALNDGFMPLQDFEDWEQKINGLCFAVATMGAGSLTVGDIDLVENVAFQCPQAGGNATLKARALWHILGKGVDKRWDDCFPDISEPVQEREQSIWQNQATIHKDLPRIFPVPATDQMTIWLPDLYLNSHMQMFAASGVAVRSEILKETANSIDIGHLPAGVYFVCIRSYACPPVALKVVVQK